MTHPLQVDQAAETASSIQAVARMACGTQQRAVAGVLYKRATESGGDHGDREHDGNHGERERERAAGVGAHGDDDGTLGEVGDGPGPTNLMVMAVRSEVEDDPGEVVRGLLEGRGSVRWVEDGVTELVG